MKASSHVTPILVLVVVLVALVSAYAWFSSGVTSDYSDVITTGSVAIISISNLDASNLVDKYTGQKGFYKENGSYHEYASDHVEAPYNVYLTHKFNAAASSDMTVSFSLEKAIIELPNTFSRNLAWVLSNSFNVDVNAQDYDYTKYYSTDVDTAPTGNYGYYAVGATTSTIRKIVLLSSVVNDYFYFKAWRGESLSDTTTASTALTYPITFTYSETVSASTIQKTPTEKYVRMHIGYYGKVTDSSVQNQNNTYMGPFIFNATQYSGSQFKFTVKVEA